MNARVMMVDDNVRLTRTLARGFNDLRPDWELVIAHNCREARDMFLEKSPSAALLDLDLPDGNGLDLMGSMRKVQPRLPVVVMTGGHLPELRPNWRDDTGFAFVEKPFSLFDMVDILESELHHACLVSQAKACKENIAIQREIREVTALANRPEMRALALCSQLTQVTFKLRTATAIEEQTSYPAAAGQRVEGQNLNIVTR